MRTFISLLLFLPALAMGGPQQKIFKYECEHIKPDVAHFTCTLKDGLHLRILRKKSDLSVEQGKRYSYEFNKITMSYLKAGGRSYEVTSAFWPRNAIRQCVKVKNRARFFCTDYLIQQDGTYKEVNK